MSEKTCSLCHGRGGDIIIECRDCNGSGYDFGEDNPFAQCHTCYGEGEEEVEICPECGGEGVIEDYEDNYFQESYFPSQHTFQNKDYDFDEEIGLYLPQEQKIIQNEIIPDLNESIAKLIIAAEKNPELLKNIHHRDFENFIADLFKREGFKVEVTKKTRDGGRDIIAIRSDFNIKVKYLIECKRHQWDNKVGVDIVRQLYGVQQAESANKSIIVTTSKFTKDAINFASKENTEWHMQLSDYNELLKWTKIHYENNLIF